MSSAPAITSVQASFDPTAVTGRTTEVGALNKINDFLSSNPAENLIFIYDIDLTLANKPRSYFSGAAIDPHCFANLAALFHTGHGVFCTGRGHSQVLDILTRAAPSPSPRNGPEKLPNFSMPPITIAHNTGAMIHFPGANKGELIVPKGQDMETFRRAARLSLDTARNIQNFIARSHPSLERLAQTHLTLEPRELTSAVVITEHGDFTWDFLNTQVGNLIDRLSPNDGRELVNFKGRTVNQGGTTMGYIDITPKGITKAPAVSRILERIIGDQNPEKFFVVTAGDNAAEIPMMEAAARIMPASNRLSICVGDNRDLAPHADLIIKGQGKQTVYRGSPVCVRLTQAEAVKRHGVFIKGLHRLVLDRIMPPNDGATILNAPRSKAVPALIGTHTR